MKQLDNKQLKLVADSGLVNKYIFTTPNYSKQTKLSFASGTCWNIECRLLQGHWYM
ncbi:MAG: hypothetical protein J6562_04200 [Candidatus Schmidhempelia sp.]|nr:hypothetical protein [Candidatus Schmidhempelia sp.]